MDHLPDLIERVHAGVVHVEFTRADGYGNGSGFLIDPAPRDKAATVVVTNAHVAADTTELWVRCANGEEAEARVRLCDEATDIALLETSGLPAEPLPLRPLKEVRVGEFVIALGSPYGFEARSPPVSSVDCGAPVLVSTAYRWKTWCRQTRQSTAVTPSVRSSDWTGE